MVVLEFVINLIIIDHKYRKEKVYRPPNKKIKKGSLIKKKRTKIKDKFIFNKK